jgi:hypothetical protein
VVSAIVICRETFIQLFGEIIMAQELTVDALTDVAKMTLLSNGGVDNWDWYGQSLEDYGYEEVADPYEDAANWLSALEAGGVDNWDWYGESLTGLYEYEEYLEGLDDLTQALDVISWKAKAEDDEPAVVEVVEVPEPVVEEKPKFSGAAEEALYARIVSKFGADRADEILALAKSNGVWAAHTFPTEFDKAIKVIKKGVEDPLEKARAALYAAVVRNGKLDKFLDELV